MLSVLSFPLTFSVRLYEQSLQDLIFPAVDLVCFIFVQELVRIPAARLPGRRIFCKNSVLPQKLAPAHYSDSLIVRLHDGGPGELDQK